MLDNLRDQASFQEEEQPVDAKEEKPPKPRMQIRSLDQITGMTAPQRFALAVMLTVIVILLGVAFLLISGKVVPAFLH